MRVLITGAGGFLGRRVTRELVGRGALRIDGEMRPLTELVLADRSAPTCPGESGMAVRAIAGDLGEAAFCDRLAGEAFDAVIHLAALLTLEAEREPARAEAVHVEAVRRLIATAGRPRLVFASSIAVFGGPGLDEVDEMRRPLPQTTYGTHKLLVELMLADASRHGRVDARALRLPIVLVRPGAATPAVSDRVAALVREPLAGRDVICPFDPEAPLPVASAGAAVQGLLALLDHSRASLPPDGVIHLPAVCASPAEMAAAMVRGGRPEAAGRIRFVPDAALQAVVEGWPRCFLSVHAARLGIMPDKDFDAIIADHLQDIAHDDR